MLQHLLTNQNFCFRPLLSSVTVKGLGFDPPCKQTSWPAVISWMLAEAPRSWVRDRRPHCLQHSRQHVCIHFPRPPSPGGWGRWDQTAASLCTKLTESQERTPELGAPESLSKDVCSLLQKETLSLSSKAACLTNSLDVTLQMRIVGVSSHETCRRVSGHGLFSQQVSFFTFPEASSPLWIS